MSWRLGQRAYSVAVTEGRHAPSKCRLQNLKKCIQRLHRGRRPRSGRQLRRPSTIKMFDPRGWGHSPRRYAPAPPTFETSKWKVCCAKALPVSEEKEKTSALIHDLAPDSTCEVWQIERLQTGEQRAVAAALEVCRAAECEEVAPRR